MNAAKANLRSTCRQEISRLRNKRDATFSSILTKNPASAFKLIKSSKSSATASINKLKVQDTVFAGEDVPDGFFSSLSALKAPDLSELHESATYQETLLDYENVLKIARNGVKMPPISPKTSTEILYSLRPNVNDFYSITAAHFINAGFEGLEHFNFLLNLIIENVNLSSLE